MNIADAHHDDERARFLSAVDRWVAACCPDSPWHAHFDASVETHVAMKHSVGNVLGVGLVAREDENHHIPKMRELWIRHDIWEILGCGSSGNEPCAWYSKADPDVPITKIDSWSVWQEETGHAQNISHHQTNDCGYTMSGRTCPGDSAKRHLTDHLKLHACSPYRRVHGAC